MQTKGKHYLVENDFGAMRYWNDDLDEWVTDPHNATYWNQQAGAMAGAFARAEAATSCQVEALTATKDLPGSTDDELRQWENNRGEPT